MKEQPCPRDCPERKAGCGATCERWQAYVKQRNAEYDERYRNAGYDECKHVVLKRAKHNLWLKRRK